MGVLRIQLALGGGLNRKTVLLLTPVVKNRPPIDMVTQQNVVETELSGSHAGEFGSAVISRSLCGLVKAVLPQNFRLHLEISKLSIS